MSPGRKDASKRTKKAPRKASSSSKKTAKPAAKKARKPTRPASPATRKPGKAAVGRPAPTSREAPAPEVPAQRAAAKPTPPAQPAQARKPKRRSSRKKASSAARGSAGEGRESKPGLGLKWSCYHCGAKFYDLNRPEPTCPKCGTDQRTRPKQSSLEPPSPAPKRSPMAPMTRFLEEEEPSVEFDEDEEEAAELDLDALEDGGFLEGSDEEEAEEED